MKLNTVTLQDKKLLWSRNPPISIEVVWRRIKLFDYWGFIISLKFWGLGKIYFIKNPRLLFILEVQASVVLQ